MKIELINQKIEAQKSLGFTISEFEINCPFEIRKLIGANVLDKVIRPNYIKKDLENKSDHTGYLQGLFRSSKLSENDFKPFERKAIISYLDGFSDSEEEWGSDMVDFKKLLDKFSKYSSNNLDGCYLINKEWYNEDSEKIRSREFALYDFYFVIVWVDKKDSSKLNISEWSCD